jgi:hypothetical protein
METEAFYKDPSTAKVLVIFSFAAIIDAFAVCLSNVLAKNPGASSPRHAQIIGFSYP